MPLAIDQLSISIPTMTNASLVERALGRRKALLAMS